MMIYLKCINDYIYSCVNKLTVFLTGKLFCNFIRNKSLFPENIIPGPIFAIIKFLIFIFALFTILLFFIEIILMFDEYNYIVNV